MILGPMFLFFTLGSILMTGNFKYGFQMHNMMKKNESITQTSKSTDNQITDSNDDKVKLSLIKHPTKTCPDGLMYHEHFGVPFCYILTEKHAFPPKCPYSNYMEDDAVPEIYDLYKNEAIWVKAKRNLHGEFEWFVKSPRYLDSINNYTVIGDNLTDKNCMVMINNTFILASCKQEHSSLCIYNYHFRSIGKFCSKNNEPMECIATDLNAGNKCFCISRHTQAGLPRSSFCKKLAEPDPFQNHLLLAQLAQKKSCWLGIEQKKGVLQWSSTKISVEYNFWNNRTNYSKTYAALDFSTSDWYLSDDGELQCAICEISVPIRNVTIRLTYNKEANKVNVEIDYIFGIHNYFMDEYVLACFSDYDSKSIKTKVLSSVSDVTPITSPVFTTTINVNHSYPAYYWCESIQLPDFTHIVSNKILVCNDFGKHKHEYALTLEAVVANGVDPYLTAFHVNVTDTVNQELSIFPFVNVVRPIQIVTFSEETRTMKLIVHISTGPNNLTASVEYSSLRTVLQMLASKNSSVINSITSFYRSDVCLEDTTKSGNSTLHWSESFVGKTTIPKELCLLEDSSPVTRTCLGDFVSGAYWSRPDGDCYNKEISNRTLKLYAILNGLTEEKTISKILLNTTRDSKGVLVVDVHLISEILEELQQISKYSLVHVVNIVSNIMFFNQSVMKEAQLKLNSTDITLNALDVILTNSKKMYQKSVQMVSMENLNVQSSDVEKTAVTGSLLHTNPHDLTGYTTEQLYDSNINDLLSRDFEVAVLASPELVDEVKNLNKHGKLGKDLIFSFFRNDVLFNYEEKTHETFKTVVSVLLPTVNHTFNNPIYTISKLNSGQTNAKCLYWKYGLNDDEEHIRGKWVIDGHPEIKHGKNCYAICKFNHATHYGLLVTSSSRLQEKTPEVNLALNIITFIGSGLSLIGLVGIFIIAIIFKHWRKRTRNIIMLNFSTALTAETILLFIAGDVDQHSTECILIGASLHYTLLCTFAWMTIVAFLQYRKFVLVFQQPVPHFLLKCAVFGWCLPVLPVLIILVVFPHNYNQNSNGLCYPDGIFFYCFVVTPISIFSAINLFVFIKILINIFNNKIEKYGTQDHEIRLHVFIAILLFFLLGMCWIFGLGSSFTTGTTNTIFSFIFCITATLQGFVMFIFFILINNKFQAICLSIKRVIMCAKKNSNINVVQTDSRK